MRRGDVVVVVGSWCVAADDVAHAVKHFDDWYAAMPRSPRRDEIVQRNLGLPRAVLSGSLLPWDGIVDVVEMLRLPVGAVLVDLACGRGGYGFEVAERTGASLVGVDFSAEAIRQAGQCADALGRNARFVLADIAALCLRAGSVDGLMCIDAIQLVPDPAGVLTEVCRVLRPGGRVVLTTWEARDRGSDALSDRDRRVDCAAWLAAAGFTDIAVVEQPTWMEMERALWTEAADLETGGDDALVSLHNEAIAMLPLVPITRRVLASATG